MVQEDLRDLERVREISLVEHLVDLLPTRWGSPLSIANLRQDLEVDHKTVDRWLQILENLYVPARVRGRVQDRRPDGQSLGALLRGADGDPALYQVHPGDGHFSSGKITVVPFARFCADLQLP